MSLAVDFPVPDVVLFSHIGLGPTAMQREIETEYGVTISKKRLTTKMVKLGIFVSGRSVDKNIEYLKSLENIKKELLTKYTPNPKKSVPQHKKQYKSYGLNTLVSIDDVKQLHDMGMSPTIIARELTARGLEITKDGVKHRIKNVLKLTPHKADVVIVPDSIFKEYDGKNYTRTEIWEDLKERGYEISKITAYRGVKRTGINFVEDSRFKKPVIKTKKLVYEPRPKFIIGENDVSLEKFKKEWNMLFRLGRIKLKEEDVAEPEPDFCQTHLDEYEGVGTFSTINMEIAEDFSLYAELPPNAWEHHFPSANF